MKILFSALPTEIVRTLQAGGTDANGQVPERHISEGDGIPCRHCLQDVAKGQPYLTLAHRPFPRAQPYAEVGPIFLHAEPCQRYDANGDLPEQLAHRVSHLVKGYRANDRILYGTGKVVPTADLVIYAKALLANPEIAYVHVRSAMNNCFTCRIERAD